MSNNKAPQLIDDERGASLFEYALLVSLIAVVAVASVSFVGKRAERTFVKVGGAVAGTNNPGGQVSFP